jgi:hypothetical protein
VVLQWAPPLGFSTASYIVEAGSASGITDQAYIDTGNAVPLYAATAVAPGAYFVRVRARASDGTLSPPSNEVVVSVSADSCTPISPPSDLSATVSGSTVALNWHAGSGGSYVVEAGSAPGAADLAWIDTQSPATSYTTSGVGAGTYFVRVRATNGCGVRSSASNEVVVNVGF